VATASEPGKSSPETALWALATLLIAGDMKKLLAENKLQKKITEIIMTDFNLNIQTFNSAFLFF
jgi:hypothetical protein